jgi:hypothetical protein
VISVGEVEQCLLDGIRAGYDVHPRDTTTEVDLLIGLFTVTLPALAHLLDSRGVPTRICGVYAHQRPYVFWPPGKRDQRRGRCELGDLLIVSRDHGSGTDQALLQQLKVRGRGRASRAQRELMEGWPAFQYDDGTAEVRRPPRGPDGRARWGEIEVCDCADDMRLVPCAHQGAREGIATSIPTQLGIHDLAPVLERMLNGRDAGLAIDAPAYATPARFSRIVWDLVDRARSRRWRYSRRGRAQSGPRLVGDVGTVHFADGEVGLFAGHRSMSFGLWQPVPVYEPGERADDDPPPDDFDGDDAIVGPPPAGVPVVLIERSAPDGREEDPPHEPVLPPRFRRPLGSTQRAVVQAMRRLARRRLTGERPIVRGEWWAVETIVAEVSRAELGHPPESIRRALSDLAGTGRCLDVASLGGRPAYRLRLRHLEELRDG